MHHIGKILECTDGCCIGIHRNGMVLLIWLHRNFLHQSYLFNFNKINTSIKYFFSLKYYLSYPQSFSESQRHVFNTHLLFRHLNSFGSQEFCLLQVISSLLSAQSNTPLQIPLLGIHSPLIHVA